MNNRNIIVIGASAGGFTALKSIVSGLSANLPAAIFIAWHISPDVQGIMPEVLSRLRTLPASNAVDKEPIRMGHIYVAPPDRHLLVEADCVRITHGPKENRFRPAVDPLFRSAAYAFGPRVIGVVLSGGLDDGSAGLWTIKNRGGVAVVQDPADAEIPAMPENAMRAVAVDYQSPVADMPTLLTRLVQEPVDLINAMDMPEDDKTRREVNIALDKDSLQQNILGLGELSPYTCPECHGVLTRLREGTLVRFRCHTGHAFSADSLLAELTQNIEENLWTVVRSMQESIVLLNHLGDHQAEQNEPKLAALYFNKAKAVEQRLQLMRGVIGDHEQPNADGLRQQAVEKA